LWRIIIIIICCQSANVRFDYGVVLSISFDLSENSLAGEKRAVPCHVRRDPAQGEPHLLETASQRRNRPGCLVRRDLRLPNAEKLKIKAALVSEIGSAITALGISRKSAAERMGLRQPEVSNMLRGYFAKLSERKLMECLKRLGTDTDIEIRVKRDS